jgi:hypothetical protein
VAETDDNATQLPSRVSSRIPRWPISGPVHRSRQKEATREIDRVRVADAVSPKATRDGAVGK